MKSNIQWDEENGEGLLQWTSGSTATFRVGYNPDGDKYTIGAASNKTFNITGSKCRSLCYCSFSVMLVLVVVHQEYWMHIVCMLLLRWCSDQQFIPYMSNRNIISPQNHVFISPFDMKWTDCLIDRTQHSCIICKYV